MDARGPAPRAVGGPDEVDAARQIGRAEGTKAHGRSRQETRPWSSTRAFLVERVTRIELAL
ncbi:hypothetical protein [Streptomyces sp. MUM 178J]|uniref:hypothetical protein n=1 Tax=Streptomyces sp. MUM 178J TaxID=2791991 RepID=UPI001F0458DA|nr:hypothetical protein [Streptomyces sp. MUM 178J]WRQ83592.1 hypothetical protein I3F59_024730 [Streptomyces sp. MUM 178J]